MPFGQTLGAGQNLTSEGGLFALSANAEEMLFSFDSNPPITSYFSQRLENDTPIGLEFYTVATLGNFFRVFFNKHKLHNLIKRKICILTTTTIKKTRKYIKFTIAFCEFSYFEIVA